VAGNRDLPAIDRETGSAGSQRRRHASKAALWAYARLTARSHRTVA